MEVLVGPTEYRGVSWDMSPLNMRVTVVAGVSLTGNIYPSGRTGSNPWAPSPCQGRDPATVVVRDILDLVAWSVTLKSCHFPVIT